MAVGSAGMSQSPGPDAIDFAGLTVAAFLGGAVGGDKQVTVLVEGQRGRLVEAEEFLRGALAVRNGQLEQPSLRGIVPGEVDGVQFAGPGAVGDAGDVAQAGLVLGLQLAG